MGTDLEREKRLAAEAAVALVENGMTVGLGSGSTAMYVLELLASRGLDLRCVATSPATEHAATAVGLHLESFESSSLERLDIAIDGADQVSSDGWIVKGGGGAHTREKIVAAAADRLVVVVSSNKLVERVSPPVPLELLPFGLAATLARIEGVRLREAARTPDGGILADYDGAVEDPAALAALLSGAPGVVDHGLFPPDLVSEVIVGRGGAVERVRVSGPR